MKEIMVRYILQPHHIFICIKAFRCYARSGQNSVSHYYHMLCVGPGNEHKKKPCINSTYALELLIYGFLFINKRLFISCDMGIYAIITL